MTIEKNDVGLLMTMVDSKYRDIYTSDGFKDILEKTTIFHILAAKKIIDSEPIPEVIEVLSKIENLVKELNGK